jgi:hypothetical protein
LFSLCSLSQPAAVGQFDFSFTQPLITLNGILKNVMRRRFGIITGVVKYASGTALGGGANAITHAHAPVQTAPMPRLQPDHAACRSRKAFRE